MQKRLKNGIQNAMAEGWRERLTMALKRDGRSQAEICRKAGVSHNYLRAILKEGKDPSISNMVRLAQALGVSAAWLVDGLEISPKAEKLLKAWASFPIEEQELLLEYFLRQAAKLKPPQG